jgi:ATP-dependent DNA ligase
MPPDQPAAEANTDQPQFATVQDAVISSVDWIIEPCWKGERLLARFDGSRVTLTDQHGAPAGPEAAEAADVVREAIDAQQALIDGCWTAMPFVGEGSGARAWSATLAEERGEEEGPDPVSLERRRAFVAWDLVELDGERLHDIPLQERRRLLESVLVESVRVRISPAVRLPIHSWLGAWRTSGFTHFVAKHVNSRYRHGATAEDWLQIDINPEKQPSMVGRLFGQRPRKVRRVDE